MSSAQKKWLFTELSMADKYAIVILLSSRAWIGDSEVINFLVFFLRIPLR